jgi:hypothetical protein
VRLCPAQSEKEKDDKDDREPLSPKVGCVARGSASPLDFRMERACAAEVNRAEQ